MNTHTVSSLPVSSQRVGVDDLLSLGSGEILRFGGDRRGVVIECLDGCVWVTEEGEPRDTILHSGERVVISHRGLVLVEALESAVIRFF